MAEAAKRKVRHQKVTIGLMDGRTVDGMLLGFSPIMKKLHFTPASSDVELDQPLHSDDVVYIGLHVDPEYERPKRQQNMDELRVVTVNQDEFAVYAAPVLSHSPGFFAVPQDENSHFERFFFYEHGVRYQESPQRLGDLLIDQDILGVDELDQALELQSKEITLGEVLKAQGKVSEEDISHALEQQEEQHVRLGDLLLEEDLVTEDDLDEALQIQQQVRNRPIGDILQESGKVEADQLEQALEIQNSRKMRLGEILIEAGLISDEDLQYALEQQKARGKRIGEVLLECGLVSEDQLLSALAGKFRLPAVDLDEYAINPFAADSIERELIDKYGIFPIDEDEHSLTIALADPMGLEAYDRICFQTGKKVHEVMAKPSQVKRCIDEFLKEDRLDEELSSEFLHDDADDDEPVNETEMVQAAEDAPIVKLVNRIIRNGLNQKASDIHILPQAKKITLAYRLNGQLIEENSLEFGIRKQIAARIKILCGMDIAEQRLPQDGRLLLREGKKKYEFRVSCIPNAFGESFVLRVLNKDAAVDLDKIGLRPDDMQTLSVMARKPYGLILVTGPTGSGKSTTLFAVLQSISHLPAHILTIEDPVESEIPGANQIQVNQKIGMTFARVLRNVLRHDPDVIMIGEMRDPETAEIGVEAALTGHLMFSTLHTNSAVDTIIRLNDLGIPNYLLAPSLLGVISQNLLKTLCKECRAELDAGDTAFQVVEDLGFDRPERLYRAVGCDQCNQTGYAGRVMSYEFLVVDEKVRQAIHDGKTGQDLQQVAVASGMRPKAESALQMAADGVIDYNDFIYSVM